MHSEVSVAGAPNSSAASDCDLSSTICAPILGHFSGNRPLIHIDPAVERGCIGDHDMIGAEGARYDGGRLELDPLGGDDGALDCAAYQDARGADVAGQVCAFTDD